MKTRNLELTAAPGHPLCTRCGCPLEAQASGDRVRTRCPGCADAAEYRFPQSALSHASGLVGIIAADFAHVGPEGRQAQRALVSCGRKEEGYVPWQETNEKRPGRGGGRGRRARGR